MKKNLNQNFELDFLWEVSRTLILNFTPEEIVLSGERVYNLERMYNMKVGFTKADDSLPERMMKDPIPAGPMKGHVSRLDEMLPEYYAVRGWDENGVPTDEKLTELGLK